MGLNCWNCGKDTGITGKPTRLDHCSVCLADLKACRGAVFMILMRHVNAGNGSMILSKSKIRRIFAIIFSREW